MIFRIYIVLISLFFIGFRADGQAVNERVSDVLLSSKVWEGIQWGNANIREKYAQPRMCASNLSRVLERANINSYSHTTVLGMLRKIRRKQFQTGKGKYEVLPIASKSKTLSLLNRKLNGRLEPGTIIAGCSSEACRSSEDGKQHIGIITNIDKSGVVWVHHNNWLREADRKKFGRYMVSARNMSEGHERQWMKTPWIKIKKIGDKIIDYKVLVPEIDDFNPNLFSIILSTLPELEGEGESESYAKNKDENTSNI